MTRQIYELQSMKIRVSMTKVVCLTLLTAVSNWLFMPVKYGPRQVFAEQHQPLPMNQLPGGEITAPGNKSGIFFEANRGQLDKRVKFSANGSGYKLFLTSTEAVYVIPERKAVEAQDPRSESELPAMQAPKSSRAVSVWMKLSGANQTNEMNRRYTGNLTITSEYSVRENFSYQRSDFGRVIYDRDLT